MTPLGKPELHIEYRFFPTLALIQKRLRIIIYLHCNDYQKQTAADFFSEMHNNDKNMEHLQQPEHTRWVNSLQCEYIWRFYTLRGPTETVSRSSSIHERSFKGTKQTWLLNDRASPNRPWKCFTVRLIWALCYFCCVEKATTLPAARVHLEREGKWDCMSEEAKVRGEKKTKNMNSV